MTADIINLRQARKRRDKAAQQAEADANRIKFGRTKHERDQATKVDALSAKRLDGHRLEQTPGLEREPDPFSRDCNVGDRDNDVGGNGDGERNE